MRMCILGLTFLLGLKVGAVGVDVTPPPHDATPSGVIPHPEPAADDHFGTAVSADDAVILVGVPRREVNGVVDAGGAYLIRRGPGGTRTEPSAKPLLNEHPRAKQLFGGAVALAGRIAIIGAYHDDAAAPLGGAVYFFNADPASPGFGDRLAVVGDPARGRDNQFGSALAACGPVVLAGAPNDSHGALHAGSAYVLNADPSAGPVGSLLQSLRNPSPAPGDFMGASVALSEEYVLVGAPGDDTGGADAGAAFLFEAGLKGERRAPVLELFDPDRTAGDQFGASVALGGGWLAVGAPGAERSLGAVYVGSIPDLRAGMALRRLGKPWKSDAPVRLGRSLAMHQTRLWYAGLYHDSLAQGGAAAYACDLSGDRASLDAVHSPDPMDNTFLGYSLSVGGGLLLLGSPLSDVAAPNAGSVIIIPMP